MAQVIINPDKTISINGNRTFVVGLFNACYNAGNNIYECDMSTKADFNFVHSEFNPGFVFNNSYNVYWDMRTYYPTPIDLVSKPLFFGWTQPDEPNLKDPHETVGDLISQYTNIKSIDPNHPVILNHYYDLHLWDTYCDILAFDFYTIRTAWFPNGNSVSWQRYDSIYAYEKKCLQAVFNTKELNEFNKPVCATIQANGAEIEYMYVPTLQEARANTYSAICMDAKGILFWSYHIMRNNYASDYGLYINQPLFTYYKQLARELRQLNDILISETVGYSWHGHPDKIHVTFSPDPSKIVDGDDVFRFSYILKKLGNIYYLIVVNKDSTQTSNVRITIPELGTGTYLVKTLGLETSGSQRADRTLSLSDGILTDDFDGYAVHIYEITNCNAPSCSYTISQV